MSKNEKRIRVYPKVSVIIPVYNEKRYLEESINSILAQTYQNIELIIVDSSSDLSIWDNIDLKNPKIRYFWIPKNGIANALNYGMNQAEGEYIARMDSDDISYADRLEKQVYYLEKNPTVMLVGAFAKIIDDEGNVTGESDIPTEYQEIKCKLLFRCCIYHPTVMFRKKLFLKGFKYNEKLVAEDYDLWTRIALNHEIRNLPDYLLFYRIHNSNVSKKLLTEGNKVASYCVGKYISSLFNINVDAYKQEDIYLTRHLFNNDPSLPDYIVTQARLLFEIWRKNTELNKVNQQNLVDVLNERWRWVISYYGNEYDMAQYSNIIFDTFKYIKKGSKIFLEDLCIRYNYSVNQRDAILYSLKQELLNLDKDKKKFWNVEQTYILYGLGRRGNIFLDEIRDKNICKKFSWKLVGVSDRCSKKVCIGNEYFNSINPENLKSVKVDFIIVTPLQFDEIKQILIGNGVAEEKIISADMFI